MSRENEINTFPEALERARHKLGWRKRELAEELEVSTRTLHRWESGDSLPRGEAQRREVAEVLAQVIPLSVISELLGLEHIVERPVEGWLEGLAEDAGEASRGGTLSSAPSSSSPASPSPSPAQSRLDSDTYQEVFSPRGVKLAYNRIRAALREGQLSYCDRVGYDDFDSSESREALSELLLSGDYVPTRPPKFYEVKPSYLQRTFTLLPARDDIVYHAIINHIATRAYAKLKTNEGLALSNRLNPSVERGLQVLDEETRVEPMLEKWRPAWRRFRDKVNSISTLEGTRYVIEIDVASFYDNISHPILFKTLERDFHIDAELLRLLETCLNAWSGVRDEPPIYDGSTPGLGIPQGNQASDLLAELYLFPLDEFMKEEGVIYARYVDDLRVYGDSRTKLQRLLLKIEIFLKRRGLSLNTQKTKIKSVDPTRPIEDTFNSEELSLQAIYSEIRKLAHKKTPDEPLYDDEGEIWRSETPPDRRALILCTELYHRLKYRSVLSIPDKVMDSLFSLLELYPWRAHFICRAISLFSGHEPAKAELLRLVDELGHYEQVQHYLFETLAISHRFTVYELSRLLTLLPKLTWYAKRSMYYLLLKHCKEQTFFQSIEVSARRETHPILVQELSRLMSAWSDEEELLNRYSRINNIKRGEVFVQESFYETIAYQNTLRSIVYRPSRWWRPAQWGPAQWGQAHLSKEREPVDLTDKVISRALTQLRKSQSDSQIHQRMSERLESQLKRAYPHSETRLVLTEPDAEVGEVWIDEQRHPCLLLRARLRYDLTLFTDKLSLMTLPRDTHEQEERDLFVVTNLIEPRLKRSLEELALDGVRGVKWLDCAGNHNWSGAPDAVCLPDAYSDLVDVLKTIHVRLLFEMRMYARWGRDRTYPISQSQLAELLGRQKSGISDPLDLLAALGLITLRESYPSMNATQYRVFKGLLALLDAYL